MLSKTFKEHCKKCEHHSLDHIGNEKYHYCAFGYIEPDEEALFIWGYQKAMNEEQCPLYLEYVLKADSPCA